MRLVHTALHKEPQHEERQAGREKVVEGREREREGGQLLQRELSCRGAIGLTSEHLQSSKWAWRKSRAAFLYFLFSSSASPAEHLSLQAISWLAATVVDWPLCAVAGSGSSSHESRCNLKRHACYHFWCGLCFAVVVQHLLPVLKMDTDLDKGNKLHAWNTKHTQWHQMRRLQSCCSKDRPW